MFRAILGPGNSNGRAIEIVNKSCLLESCSMRGSKHQILLDPDVKTLVDQKASSIATHFSFKFFRDDSSTKLNILAEGFHTRVLRNNIKYASWKGTCRKEVYVSSCKPPGVSIPEEVPHNRLKGHGPSEHCVSIEKIHMLPKSHEKILHNMKGGLLHRHQYYVLSAHFQNS